MKKEEIKLGSKTLRMYLETSEETHNEVMYDTALEWLNRHYGKLPALVAELERSKVFWLWWSEQWHLRNYELLREWGYVPGELEQLSDFEWQMLFEAFKRKHNSSYWRYPSPALQEVIKRTTAKAV